MHILIQVVRHLYKVEDALLSKFGQWDSTNDLIRHAISVLSERIDDLEDRALANGSSRRSKSRMRGSLTGWMAQLGKGPTSGQQMHSV